MEYVPFLNDSSLNIDQNCYKEEYKEKYANTSYKNKIKRKKSYMIQLNHPFSHKSRDCPYKIYLNPIYFCVADRPVSSLGDTIGVVFEKKRLSAKIYSWILQYPAERRIDLSRPESGPSLLIKYISWNGKYYMDQWPMVTWAL